MSRLLAVALLGFSLVVSPAVIAADAGDDEYDKVEDLYWSEKRIVRSIQKKEFLKDSRHAFTLTFGTIPNDEFFFYFPLGLRYSYLWTEDIAMEIWANYIAAAKTDLEGYLTENFNSTLIVEVPEQLLMMGGLNATWSPLQGKFSIFDDSLLQFDLFATVGAGFILTEAQNLGRTQLRPNMSGNVGLGFQLYLNQLISLRFDYRQYFYPAAKICNGGACKGGGLAHPAEFTVGVTLWTEAPE